MGRPIGMGCDIGANVTQKVCAVPGLSEGGFEARELSGVLGEDLAVAGEVCGFQGARGGGCGVQKAGEGGEKGFALGERDRVSINWTGVR